MSLYLCSKRHACVSRPSYRSSISGHCRMLHCRSRFHSRPCRLLSWAARCDCSTAVTSCRTAPCHSTGRRCCFSAALCCYSRSETVGCISYRHCNIPNHPSFRVQLFYCSSRSNPDRKTSCRSTACLFLSCCALHRRSTSSCVLAI